MIHIGWKKVVESTRLWLLLCNPLYKLMHWNWFDLHFQEYSKGGKAIRGIHRNVSVDGLAVMLLERHSLSPAKSNHATPKRPIPERRLISCSVRVISCKSIITFGKARAWHVWQLPTMNSLGPFQLVPCGAVSGSKASSSKLLMSKSSSYG